MTSICIFLGASPGNSPIFKKAVIQMAAALVKKNITLVYGGSNVGLMKVLADEVLSLGGKVIGVTSEHLFKQEVAYQGLTELHITNSLSERKKLMTQLADAFITLPGGIGTMDEFFEVWTLVRIGTMTKPIGLLNTHDFYSPLFEFIDHMRDSGFIQSKHVDIVKIDQKPSDLIDKLLASCA